MVSQGFSLRLLTTMKISLKRNPAGNALLIALIASTILGTGVASYLTLVNSQYKSVRRSQNWNGRSR